MTSKETQRAKRQCYCSPAAMRSYKRRRAKSNRSAYKKMIKGILDGDDGALPKESCPKTAAWDIS